MAHRCDVCDDRRSVLAKDGHAVRCVDRVQCERRWVRSMEKTAWK